ncbi:MAG: glutamate ABC transporter substrate-binding protein [bacterium]
MKLYPRFLLLLLAIVGAIALFAACGDDDDDATATPAGTKAATQAAVPTFAADSTMAKIVAKGKLTVGVKFDQPGFGLKDPVTGKVDGFDVQMAKEIAKALGLKEEQVEFVESVSANRIPFLQEDKVDLVIATMTINADRKTQIEFSRPYYLAGQSILVKKDNTTITKVDDLNGKNVCSVQGSTSETNVKTKAPQANLLSLTGYAACVDSLKSGRVDAVSTDDIILAGFAASDNTLKLVGGQFTQEPYGIGIKKGKTDMAAFVDALLTKEFADGTWDKIYDKYLGKVEGLPKAADARAKLPPTN